MQLTIYTDDSAFDALAEEWNALVDCSQVGTPFQRCEFQRVWWQHFGTGALRIIALRGDTQQLLGIAALFVDAEGILRWLGGEEIADYLDIIARPEDMAAVAEAVFEWWCGAEAPAWQRAQLSNMPHWSDTAPQWQALAQAHGWQAEVERLDVCPVAPLAATFDDYLAVLDKKQRHEIRRKLRRAGEFEQPVQMQIVGAEDDLTAATNQFMDLMATSGPHKERFLTPQMRAAFAEIIQVTQASGLLQFAFLRVGDAAVATYLNFRLNGRVYVYNSGLDLTHEARSFSPGWVLLAHLIEHAIAEGYTEFDFMQGDEDYKYRFGGVDNPVMRLTIEK